MKNIITHTLILFAVLCGSQLSLNAQVTATSCFNGPQSYNNTPAGTAVPIIFPPGTFPAGSQIVDVDVSVYWSQTSVLGNCTNFGTASDYQQVSFAITDGTTQITLADLGTWNGTFNQGKIATTFSSDGAAIVAGSLPTSGTFRSTGVGSLDDYIGTTAGNPWQFIIIDNNGTVNTCIDSICVRVVACQNSLNAVCKTNVTLPLDNTGNLDLAFSDLDNGSDTSCLLNSITFSQNNFTCADHGSSFNITMSLEDNLGNTSNCTSTVMVMDTSAPVVNCRDFVVEVGNTGNVNFVANDSLPQLFVSDNCGPPAFRINGALSRNFTCADIGPQPVTFTIADRSGNVAVCNNIIMVQDSVPPTALCQNMTTYINASGQATISPTAIDNGSSDVCSGITSRSLDRTNFTCADIGTPQTVTLTVQDFRTNQATCTAQITVLDTLAPSALCQNIDAYLDAAGNVTITAIEIDGGSTDNCTTAGNLDYTINGGASVTYSCTDIGIQVVTLEVTDEYGFSSQCTAQITVRDTLGPNMVCQNIDAYLDAAGNVTVSATALDGGSVDACSGTNVTFSIGGNPSATFTCAAVGTPQVVMLMGTDTSGNSNTCSATITVLDTIAPTAVCAGPFDVYLSGAGTATVDTTDLNDGSTDNCGTAGLSYNIGGNPSTTFTCAAVGTPQNVVLTVEDAGGATDNCTTVVTVIDTVPPTAACQNITVGLSAGGNVTVNATQIADLAGITDNCGAGNVTLYINTVGQTQENFACANIGPNNVRLIVEDPSGMRDTCTAVVTVEDNIPPTPICQNVTMSVDASGNATIDAVDIANTTLTSDNCGIANYYIISRGQTQVTYTCAQVGTTIPTTLIVEDVNGNIDSCTAQVTIEDNVNPTASCINISGKLDPVTGTFEVFPADIDGGSADNCPALGLTMTVNGQPSVVFDCDDLGNNVITLIVEDAQGNVDSCSATVFIEDDTDPTVTCNAFTAYLTPAGDVQVLPSDIGTATDNCDPASLTLAINNQPSFTYDCDDLGLNTAIFRASDPSGNFASCQSRITVVDTVPPTAVCQSVNVYLPASGIVSVAASQLDGGSTDNCAVSTFRINGSSNQVFTCAEVGANPVTLTVRDNSNRTSTCTDTIFVIDSLAPVVNCTNQTIQLDASGTATITAATIATGSTDNCGPITATINGKADTTFVCASAGLNSVTVQVEDASNNVSFCTVDVTVEDNIDPTAMCKDDTIYLDNAGGALLTLANVDNGSTDNCGIVNSTLSKTNFTCADLGLNTVTLTVEDPSNNTASCQSTVTVLDTIPPVAICQNITVALDASGLAVIGASDINNGSFDNCANVTVQLAGGASSIIYDCDSVGLRTVELEVIDRSGNRSTCTATVDVVDNISPDANCVSSLTVTVGPSGSVQVFGAQLDNGSTDNCASSLSYFINGLPSVSYNCSDVGTSQVVTLRVFDGSGNFDDCTTTINIVDSLAPTALCGNMTVSLSNSGTINVNALSINNGSTDNCAGNGLSFLINGKNVEAYTCSDIGANTATLTVIDASGNRDSCQATVTVEDVTNPVASCQTSIVAVLNASGDVTITGLDLDNGSTDNCGIESYLINNQPSFTYTCADIGNQVATLTVVDTSGNSDDCLAIVQVQDTTAPIVRCLPGPIDVFLPAVPSATVTVNAIDLDNGSTDNCGIENYLINGVPAVTYTCADLGIQNVRLTVVDSNSNQASCNTSINVRDTVSPTALCQNITVSLNAAGIASVSGTDIDGGSTDNCSISQYLINGRAVDTFTCADLGRNNVILTIEDAAGNQSFCTAEVTVEDNLAPTITCNNLTVYLDAAGQAVVDATDAASATDNCGPLTFTINGNASATYDCSHIGSPQVANMQVTDGAGLSDQCQSIITVEDTIAPTAICTNYTVSIGIGGTATVQASDIDGGSRDNCSIAQYLIDGQPSLNLNCTDVGIRTVALTVIDGAGNRDTCFAQLTIEDNINPVAVCQNNLVFSLSSNGEVVVSGIQLDNGSTDNCNINQYLINGKTRDTFTCANVGNVNVTLTVVDASGNSNTCNTTITIEDNQAPTVFCVNNLTAYLDNSGLVTVNAQSIDNGSTDNCAIQSYLINGQPFVQYDCSVVNTPQTATLTVTDIYGNSNTCTSTITVVDTVPPTAVCNNITIDISQTGQVVLTGDSIDINNASTDNCAILFKDVNPDTLDCDDIGIIPVTMTVIDIYGNTSSCVAQVTVRSDAIQPSSNTPVCEGDNITLFANPPNSNFTYSWTGPNGFTSTQQNPIVPNASAQDSGMYILTATPTGSLGCPSVDSTRVFVNVVTPPAIVANAPLCIGDTAILTIPTVYNGTTVSYEWFFEGTNLNVNNDTLILPTLTKADSGAYVAVVTVDGCSDTSLIPYNLIINDLPLTPVPTADVTCEGDTLFLSPNTTTSGLFFYSWTGPNGFISSDSIAAVPNASQLSAGTYTLTITDVNSCAAVGTVTTTIKQTPQQPDIQSNSPLCVGDLLELTENTSYPLTPLDYTWTLPDGSSQSTANIPQLVLPTPDAGTYRLVVTMDGCPSNEDTVAVSYQAVPLAANDAFTMDFRDSLMNFDVVTPNDAVASYTIGIVDSTKGGRLENNGDGTFNYYPAYSYFGTDTFQYFICSATCPNSCDTAQVIITVETDFECFIPTGISPNGDGINDILEIRCVNEYPNRELIIYNRWGNEVYRGNGTDFNGQFNGKDLPDGTFFYILKLNDTTYVPDDEFKGYFVIHR